MLDVGVDLTEEHARDLDAQFPSPARDRFLIPAAAGGPYAESAYFAGNSLGLQSTNVRPDLEVQLQKWADIGVNGHFTEPAPWVDFPDRMSASMARVVGAKADEVFVMNGLTVNLHLLLVSFYRPSGARTKIVIEDHAFPSDSYAVRSHVEMHGLDPDVDVIRLMPRPGNDVLDVDDIIATLHERGPEIATVLLSGVNYLTGEAFDIPRITKTGHEIGATVGWDLAHAAGNIELNLHDDDVDFAAWCTYKYLNGGPGSVAAAFIHERHLADQELPRLEGWFGHVAETQFLMRKKMHSPTTARAWSMSTPHVFALSPVKSALAFFDEIGMPALRARSLQLSDYLLDALDPLAASGHLEVVTPREHARRGTQISVRVKVDPVVLTEDLQARWGVVPDERKPDILRFAPVALYCTFHDCWRAAEALARELTGRPLG